MPKLKKPYSRNQTRTQTQESADVFERVKPLPPQEIAHSISGFTITTDSVVAKATIETDTNTRRIILDWGDGEIDTITILPGRQVKFDKPVAGGVAADPIPAGTYEIFHEYAEPADRRTFEQTIFLHVENTNGGDDFRFQTISLTPRYRIVHYQARFQVRETSDVESETQNFKVVMSLDGKAVHEYKLDLPNTPAGPVTWHLLEGSQFAHEVSFDSQVNPGVTVRFNFTEADFVSNDQGAYSIRLDYLMKSESVESVFSLSDWLSESSRIAIRYDREVTLVANMPRLNSSSSYQEQAMV